MHACCLALITELGENYLHHFLGVQAVQEAQAPCSVIGRERKNIQYVPSVVQIKLYSFVNTTSKSKDTRFIYTYIYLDCLAGTLYKSLKYIYQIVK